MKFSDCSDVCAGDPPMVITAKIGKSLQQLDCCNNGGQIIRWSLRARYMHTAVLKWAC